MGTQYKDFELIWRFTDAKKYTQLSQLEFVRFQPIPQKESIELWNTYVYPSSNSREHHLTELYVQRLVEWPDCPNFRTNSDSEEKEIVPLLLKAITASDSATLFFFWHAEVCVKTDWGLFLEHWDDFCYPSDDSNVIVIPDIEKALIYIEEQWHVMPRKHGNPIFSALK